MAHKYLIDFLLCAVCLTVVVLSVSFIVLAEDMSGYTARPESLAVFAAGVGLAGIGILARRRLRSKEKG